VIFKFFGNMRVEVTCIYVDFTIRIVILLGQRVEEFFNVAFAWAHVYTSDVDWACY